MASFMTTPAEIDPALGRALRALREQQGLSQEDFAHKAGITTSALSRIERGASNPTWSTITSILAALDASLRDLEAAIERVHR